MLLVPLRIPPALAEHRVARRIVSRRAALDEIGERLGWRAGDVDAVPAQLRDHARAGLRLVHPGGELGRAVPPGGPAVGEGAPDVKLAARAKGGGEEARCPTG